MHDAEALGCLEAQLRQSLPRWGVDRATPMTLLTISENATFLAVPAHGPKIVFRVHRPGYHDLAEIRSELAWLMALRRDGVAPTPEPLACLDGSLIVTISNGRVTRHVVAFSFMPGREPVPGSDLARWYRTLGGITARLHRHADGWRQPVGFRRKIWTFDTIAGDRAVWGRWQDAQGLDAAGHRVLERVMARLRADLATYGMGRDTFGLIHCDLRPANLLVDGDTLAVIDFDDCGFSWRMYDFAASVSFMEHEPFIPELEAAWLDGYAAVAPVSTADIAMLPSFRILRRVQLLAWIASHAEAPTAQSMGSAFTTDTVALAEAHLTATRASQFDGIGLAASRPHVRR